MATEIRCTNCNLPAKDHNKREGWCLYPLLGWHSTKFAPPTAAPEESEG